jgi:hypothetical protein
MQSGIEAKNLFFIDTLRPIGTKAEVIIMPYENETVLKIESTTYTNVTMKGAAASIAKTATGVALGGIVGDALQDSAMKKVATMNMGGQAVLTNGRFIFGTGKKLKKLPVGGPFVISEKDEVYFDIPLATIISVTQGKQGLSPVFAIETIEGVFKFAFMKKSKCEEWEAAINNALGQG